MRPHPDWKIGTRTWKHGFSTMAGKSLLVQGKIIFTWDELFTAEFINVSAGNCRCSGLLSPQCTNGAAGGGYAVGLVAIVAVLAVLNADPLSL